MRLLLATAFLNRLGGMELFYYDLARGLADRGHRVTCWVRELDPDAPLARQLAAQGVVVSDVLPDERLIEAVVFQGKETFPTWRAHFRNVPRFAVCHGPKQPEEIAPPHVPGTTHLALTREGLEYLHRRGYPDLVYTGYGVDLRRFAPAGALPDRPRRAVIHCKYCDREVAREACARLGIEVAELGVRSWQPGGLHDDHAGLVEIGAAGTVVDHDPRTVAWHVEDVLAGADVVFGMGRSAVEALATGKACVAYGYGAVGDGLVTAERLDECSRVNFSGRVRRRTFDVDAMVEELLLYSAEQGQRNRSYAAMHYDLDAFLDRVEERLCGVSSAVAAYPRARR
jgi:hypothetical protein